MDRFPRLLSWRREHSDAIDLISGFVLIACALGILTLGVVTYVQGRRDAAQARADARLAHAACLRSVKYGPYLAKAYATDFDTRPDHVFRLMPLSAARAYKASIPKHC